jgi:outer membrane murein-binding lipoprotein Lpp
VASHQLKKASDFLTSAKSDNIDKASKEARETDQSYGQLKAKAYLQSEEYKALFDHEHKAMREAERKKLQEEPKKKRERPRKESTVAKIANAPAHEIVHPAVVKAVEGTMQRLRAEIDEAEEKVKSIRADLKLAEDEKNEKQHQLDVLAEFSKSHAADIESA